MQGEKVVFPKILVSLAVSTEQIGKGHMAGKSLKQSQDQIMRAKRE